MEFKQYLHNKGQQDILKDELIKEYQDVIRLMQDEIDHKDKLIEINERIIKQQESVIKVSEQGYATLVKITEKEKEGFMRYFR